MKEQEINRYWKKIVNTMTEGLMLVGPDGTILMVNEAFEGLTGYAADEVIGRPCTLLECDACDRTLKNSGHKWCRLFDEGQVKMPLPPFEKRRHLRPRTQECLCFEG